jgi:hypothetical protein
MSSPPPDHKYFSLQGHMVEGSGDLIQAVFHWCWVMLVLFCGLCLIHFSAALLFTSLPSLLIVEAVMPLVAHLDAEC